MKQPPTTRVLCVDDHAFLVDGLKFRLDVEPEMELVGHSPNADHLTADVQRTGAHVVLLDIEMPGRDVFDAMDELRRRCPEVRTILLSAYVRDRYIDAAYKAGAWGYLSKSDSPEAVLAGIRKVTQGKLAFSPAVMDRFQPAAAGRRGNRLVQAGSRLGLLTLRERQVLRMIAKGMSRTEIAEQLCRSPMTVDNHRKSIMRKLSIQDRVELARYAIAEGIVEV